MGGRLATVIVWRSWIARTEVTELRFRTQTLAAPSFSEGAGRPRLLIEDPDAWAYAEHFEGAGFAVALCGGPLPEGPDCSRCPLVWNGVCSAVESADVVLSALPSDVGMPIVQALAERAGRVPTVLHVPAPRAADYQQLFDDAIIVPFPASLAQLEAAVREAVAAA